MFCDLVTKNIPVSICSHKNTLCLLSPVLLCLCTVRASGMPEHKKSRCYMLYMMFLIDRKNHCTPLPAGLLTYVHHLLRLPECHASVTSCSLLTITVTGLSQTLTGFPINPLLELILLANMAGYELVFIIKQFILVVNKIIIVPSLKSDSI